MSEMFFLLIILILVGILIFLLRQNQKSSEIWKQEITNLRLEFGQQIQGTIQNINSQIQNTAFQLNQRLDNSISSLSNHVNQAITQMVGVVTSNLQTITESTGQVNQRLDNAARIMSDLMKQIGEIKEGANQIKIVGQNIARLEDLFTSPKYRGGIGEIMLEKMIQDTLPKEYYEIQFEFKDRKRVDAIIKINNKILPIDSKFPLDNYRKMTETKDESEKEKMKKEFFKDIKKRADEIASNYIRPDENTFDFAIMYVPSESIYYEIITDKENKTLEHMLNKKVIPVSPSIFYAQLSVFNMAFKTIQFERNVLQIVNSLSRLLNEFNMITSEFETLGKHINNAQSKYLEVDKKLTQFGNSFMQIAKYGTVSD